jgi:sugar/nucleoside kinase (ribokinase family)
MAPQSVDVVAAGHICLDVIPQLTHHHRSAKDIFSPGTLSTVGPAMLALGGSVANTGLALHRLGVKTRLVGKIGNDTFGKAILDLLGHVDPSISEHMIVSDGESTSYTVVFSPFNLDRGFLHCPGTNDSFTAADLADIDWHGTRLLHFGYPPLMRGTFADEGLGLAEQFSRAQKSGALVSLDMATPSADAVNWRQWLRNVLPNVDVFLPSLDEIVFMLDPLQDGRASGPRESLQPSLNSDLLAELSDELHGFGVPIVVIKLGDQGLYLSTSNQLSSQYQRAAWSDFTWCDWQGRQLLAPCFDATVVGTTGSGDCTIAGFLLALLQGAGPEQALRYATAVGAYCVESTDATSNIPTWTQLRSRLQAPWQQLPVAFPLPDWNYSAKHGAYTGPNDAPRAVRNAS